jgi:hypothetical protein
MKKGYKFKDGEVLAKNSSFFMDDEDASLSLGRLTKIAMCSSDATYEDSAFISDGFADAMTSDITMQKSITLGVNTNVLQMVKKGQEIKSGEPLLTFEHSFEDAATAKLFDNIHSDDLTVFQDLSKNVVKSKYTGVIEDIVIYYNKPIEEMTPSLQKILKGYIKEVEKKEKVVKDSSVIMKNTRMIEGTKIKGQDVDGILIEIYVTYKDVLSVGDKVSFETALKTIVSTVVPEDEAPQSDHRPNNKIQAQVTPLSFVSRMTVDVIDKMYLNKILMELKFLTADIYNSK